MGMCTCTAGALTSVAAGYRNKKLNEKVQSQYILIQSRRAKTSFSHKEN